MATFTKADYLRYLAKQHECKDRRDRSKGNTPPKLELPSGRGPLGKKSDQEVGSQRHVVCVTDYRTRLIDEDNLCAKYHIDALRYAGIIKDDCPEITRIIVKQALVKTTEEEKTVFRIVTYDAANDAPQVASEVVPGPVDRPLVYLACPYVDKQGRGREQERFDAVTKMAAHLTREGYVVFSPITHSHPMVPYGLPGDWAFWKRIDEAYLRCSRQLRVLTLDGWKESTGVNAEIEIATRDNIPLEFTDPV